MNLYALCLLTRFTLFSLALYGSLQTQRKVAYASLVIGLGFFYVYLTGSRPTGMEVPNGIIWWNALRPLHGCLYLAYAVGTLVVKSGCASFFLFADVVAGIVAYVTHYNLP